MKTILVMFSRETELFVYVMY